VIGSINSTRRTCGFSFVLCCDDEDEEEEEEVEEEDKEVRFLPLAIALRSSTVVICCVPKKEPLFVEVVLMKGWECEFFDGARNEAL